MGRTTITCFALTLAVVMSLPADAVAQAGGSGEALGASFGTRAVSGSLWFDAWSAGSIVLRGTVAQETPVSHADDPFAIEVGALWAWNTPRSRWGWWRAGLGPTWVMRSADEGSTQTVGLAAQAEYLLTPSSPVGQNDVAFGVALLANLNPEIPFLAVVLSLHVFQ